MLAVAVNARPERAAYACTGSPPTFEQAVRDGAFVALADAVSVGGPVNAAPALTATATATVTDTSASDLTASATVTKDAATATPTPAAPPPRAVDFDLTGFGATLNVVGLYAGAASAVVEIDASTRSSIEREIRWQEDAGGVSSCPLGAFAYRYEQGARYLVFAAVQPEFPLYTVNRFRVEGADVVLADPGRMFGSGGLVMSRETYERYFPGVAVEAYYDFGQLVNIGAERVPLVMFERAIAGLVAGTSGITPPQTGSAGLR